MVGKSTRKEKGIFKGERSTGDAKKYFVPNRYTPIKLSTEQGRPEF